MNKLGLIFLLRRLAKGHKSRTKGTRLSPLFMGGTRRVSRAYAKENFGVVSDGAPVERERE